MQYFNVINYYMQVVVYQLLIILPIIFILLCYIGFIPSTLGMMSTLKELYLNNNQFVGTIPSNMAASPGLKTLQLQYNQLTGLIPYKLGFSSTLSYLSMQNNQLTGSVPDTLCDSSQLNMINISNNPWLTCYPLCLTGIAEDEVGSVALCTGFPSSQPTSPSSQPTSFPTSPTSKPSSAPTSSVPTSAPSFSQFPTGQPTSLPTCQGGEINGKPCGVCPSGSYADPGAIECTLCSPGYFASESGSPTCEKCVWPTFGPISHGATNCQGFCLCFIEFWQQNLIVFSILIFYGIVWHSAGAKMSMVLAIHMIAPMFSHATDILYVCITGFYAAPLFYASLIFAFGPGGVFLYLLFQEDCYPFVWSPVIVRLGRNIHGHPTWLRTRLMYTYEVEDMMHKFFWNAFVWTVLLITQIIIGLILVIPSIIHALGLLIWFIFGVFLFASRAMAVGNIRKLWYSVWRMDKDYFSATGRQVVDVDTRILNHCVFAAFVYENIPFLIIQLINNTLTNGWTTFTLVCFISTAYIVLDNFWTFVYYRHWKKYPLHKVPISSFIPASMEGFQIEPCFAPRFIDPNRKNHHRHRHIAETSKEESIVGSEHEHEFDPEICHVKDDGESNIELKSLRKEKRNVSTSSNISLISKSHNPLLNMKSSSKERPMEFSGNGDGNNESTSGMVDERRPLLITTDQMQSLLELQKEQNSKMSELIVAVCANKQT